MSCHLGGDDRILGGGGRSNTLPETNSSPRKIDGWKTIKFPFLGPKRPIFRCKLAVSFREGFFAYKKPAVLHGFRYPPPGSESAGSVVVSTTASGAGVWRDSQDDDQWVVVRRYLNMSLKLLMVQKSQTTTWDVQNPVNNGINKKLSTGERRISVFHQQNDSSSSLKPWKRIIVLKNMCHGNLRGWDAGCWELSSRK